MDKKGKELFGSFQITDQVFKIAVTLLDNDDYNVYQFKFYRDNKTKAFNDYKYAFGVYSTIKAALHYAVEALKPDVLVFASSDESSARKVMYKSEAGNIATKYNYSDLTRSKDLKEMGYDDNTIFGIYKSDKIIKDLLDEISPSI